MRATLKKGVLKLSSKFTVEHSCPITISIKLLCNFIEIAFRQGCSTVHLLHIFGTSLSKNKNTSGRLLLVIVINFWDSENFQNLLTTTKLLRLSSQNSKKVWQYIQQSTGNDIRMKCEWNDTWIDLWHESAK